MVNSDKWNYTRIIKIQINLPKISRVKFEKRLNFVIKKNEIYIFLFENRRSSKNMLFGYFVCVLISHWPIFLFFLISNFDWIWPLSPPFIRLFERLTDYCTALAKVSDWNSFRVNQNYFDSFRYLYPSQCESSRNLSEKRFVSRLMKNG